MSAQQTFDANSAILAQTRAEFEASRKQVFFIDASVPGYEQLVTGLGENGKVFTIDANSNALAQVASALESVGGDVDGVHIYSHGRDGALQLGGQWIDTAAVDNSAAILDRIGNALTANADILLYGCNVAKTASGLNFMERVAALTRADVAASSDATGNANNWTLEKATGPIETEVSALDKLAGMLGTGYWGAVNAKADSVHYTGFYSNDIFHATGDNVTLEGGDGNDVYYVDNGAGAATILEKENEGTDTLVSRVADFALNKDAQVEHIILDSSGFDKNAIGQNVTGNQYTTRIDGNSLSNNLTGGSTRGGVYLNGGDGDDFLDGGDGKLSTIDGGMTETEYGSTLVGGKGNDSYIIRNARDVITEAANQGIDNVYAASDYTLGANLENLTLLNSGKVGTGNALNNILKSTQGSSTLFGGAGHDVLYASQDGEGDSLVGGAGNDTYYVYKTDDIVVEDKGDTRTGNTDIVYSTVNYTLGDNIEHLTLNKGGLTGKGNTLNNTITGFKDGKNTLDGGVGADVMVGGGKDDVFYIDNAGDRVVENADEGTDTIFSDGIAINLGSANHKNVEFVKNISTVRGIAMTGTASAETFIGNDFADTIDGKGGADSINAGDGNDLVHFYGAETMDGGDGDDTLYVHDNFTMNANQRGFEAVQVETNKVFGVDISNSSIGMTVFGSAANNSITGSAHNDTIYGGGGVDTIDAGAGNDFVEITANFNGYGGMDGGAGQDTLSFGGANDTVTINADNTITQKVVSGRTQKFITYAVNNFEAFAGGAGNDSIIASGRTDNLTLDGGAGNDTITGGAGNDVLIGGAGVDVMTGGAGNDTYYIDNANDRVVEGADQGTDVILSDGVAINLGGANHKNVEVVQNISTVRGIAMTGTLADETFVGNAFADTIDGKDGADSINAGDGNDFVHHYGKETTIIGGAGLDTLYVHGDFKLAGSNISGFEAVQVESGKTWNVDVSSASEGMTVTGSNVANSLKGTAYNDTIFGGGGVDTIDAGAGNDFVEITANFAGYGSFDGGAGLDTFSFGSGNDTVTFNADNSITQKVISGRSTANVAVTARNFEVFSGGAGNDSLVASARTQAIVLDGGAGNDIIVGGQGNDSLYGGAGNDVITATVGNNYLDGGAGADKLTGGAGNDIFIANGGNDTIATGNGIDIVRVTEAAAGSTITVTDYNGAADFIDDSALSPLQGWTRTCTNILDTRKNVTGIRVQWAKTGSSSIVMNLTGVKSAASIVFASARDVGSGESFVADPQDVPWLVTASGDNATVTTGNAGDSLQSTGTNNALHAGAGNDTLVGGNGGTLSGGAGDDHITLNDVRGNLSVDGGADDDSILLNSVATNATAILTGGAGSDTLTLGNKAIVNISGAGNIASIAMDGKTLSVTDGSGFESIVGSGDADRIDASAATADSTVTYTTNGGNDTFIGGKGNDVVFLHTLDSESTVSLSGDAGKDSVYFANQAINMDIGATATIGNSTIAGFESFFLGSANDTVAANINYLEGKNIAGGAGTDKLILTTTDNKGVSVALDSLGNVSQMGSYVSEERQSTPVASATASGFEAIDGSFNSMNFLDASAYTVNGGSFQLTGGSGHDMFYLGGVQGNAKVTLSGGAGDDRFHLGDVVVGSAVYVDGGSDGASGDRLYFDTSKNVNLQLNATGNISAVSLGGTKVAITTNGLDGYYGGHGNDVIDARYVTSVDSASKTLVLKGCRSEDSAVDGNDYLCASKNVNVKTELHAGKGADTLYGDAGNDVFYLGNAAGQVNDGGDYIITGNGRDTIVVYAQADNSITKISDFNASLDTLDDSYLLNNGWARSVSADGSRITYSKVIKEIVNEDDKEVVKEVRKEFHLDFVNKGAKGLPSTQSVPDDGKLTVAAGFSGIITGNKTGDTIDASNAGPMTILGNGGNDSIIGSNNNDSIEVKGIMSGKLHVYADKDSSNDSVTPSAGGNDRITVSGAIGQDAMVTIHGGLGNDMITLDDITGGEVYIAGRDHSKEYDKTNTAVTDSDTVRINDISGGTVTVHTSGNASTVKGATWGLVDVQNVKGSASVNIDTGNYNDTVRINSIAESARVTLTADEGNDNVSITAIAGGHSSIDGQEGDDNIVVSSINGGAVTLLGNAGADSITVTSIEATEEYIHIDGGADDDHITVGNVTDSNAVLKGSAGNDVISVNAITETGEARDHEFFIYGNDVPETSAQSGDDSDAPTLNGNNSISIGLVDNALVNIAGGSGADTVTIGDVKGDAKIFIDAGDNPKSDPGDDHYFDELHFTGDKVLKQGVNVGIADYDSGSQGAEFSIRSIEKIEGSAYADTIDASGMDAKLLSADRPWQTMINGGDGNDELYGGASLQLRGGSGDDLLVVTGLSKTHNVWVRGDGGTDTLKLGWNDAFTSDFTLQGGYEAGNPADTVSRNGLHSAKGDIVLDDKDGVMEVIELAPASNLTWNAAYSTTLQFNKNEGASNSLTLQQGAAGSVIVIENCGADDTIFDGDLVNNGWKRSEITSVTGGSKIEWSKADGGRITVQLRNASVGAGNLPTILEAREGLGNGVENSAGEAKQLTVTGSNQLVQTGSGDDKITLAAGTSGCTVEAGAGKDIIEVFGVDPGVLSGDAGAQALSLQWCYSPSGDGQKMLSIQSQNLQGDMLLSTLHFQTSKTSDGCSDFSGDTVKLYGLDDNLLASFDLQSILNENKTDAFTQGYESITLAEGADKKFS